MKPQSIITVRFVKRLLLVFVGGIVLLMLFPSLSTVFEYVFLPVALLTIIALQLLFPKTQITVDDENIYFTRKFRDWNPLKKYYLHELIIPHADWDTWIKISLSENNTKKTTTCFLQTTVLVLLPKHAKVAIWNIGLKRIFQTEVYKRNTASGGIVIAMIRSKKKDQ